MFDPGASTGNIPVLSYSVVPAVLVMMQASQSKTIVPPAMLDGAMVLPCIVIYPPPENVAVIRGLASTLPRLMIVDPLEVIVTGSSFSSYLSG